MSTRSSPAADERSSLIRNGTVQKQQVQQSRATSVAKIIRIAVLFLGAFIAALDTSFVIATSNFISSEFHQASIASWVLNSYNLGYCIFLPMYGALEVKYGSLPPLIIAYMLFAGGCAISGFAGELWHVVLGRTLSGAGGAGMAATIAFALSDIASSDELAVYRSYINLVSIAGRSSGGPIGGIVTDAIGWRWSFIGQIPIVLLCCFVVIWLYLASEKQPKQEETQDCGKRASSVEEKGSVDIAGIVAFAVMMTSFLVIMTSVSKMSFVTQQTHFIASTMIFAVSTLSLIVIEMHYAEQPFVPLDLLTGKLGIQMFIQFLLLFAQFSIVSNVATYFVRTEMASNTNAALHLLGVPIGNAIGVLTTSMVIPWTKRYKHLATIGASSSTLGFLLMAFRWRGRIDIWESVYVGFTSFGVGIVSSTQFGALTTHPSKHKMTTLVSMFLLSQQIGTMVGISTSSALLQAIFRPELIRRLGQIGYGRSIVQMILDDTRYAFKLPLEMQDIIIRSYVRGFSAVCALSAGCSIFLQGILSIMKEQPLT